MKGGTKAALALLALWGMSGSSSRAKGAAKSPPLSPKKGEAKERPRPDESKGEPGPPVKLDPQHPDDEAPATPPGGGAKKKPTSPSSEATPPSSAPGTPPGNKLRKKRSPKAEDAALDLAESMRGVYVSRGIEDGIAAAEALTIYLLAGGADPAQLKAYQKIMGVEQSGSYDKETSTFIAQNIGLAIDGAVNLILQQEFGGEQPNKAAGLALLQYLEEAHDVTEAVPREKIAALQLGMGVTAGDADGRYNAATKERLVELGITPMDHTINENQMVVE